MRESDIMDSHLLEPHEMTDEALQVLVDYEIYCGATHQVYQREQARRAELAMTPTFPEFNLEEDNAHVG